MHIKMEMKFIKYEIENGVKTIWLNRPEVLNSFNKEMGAELYQTLENAAYDKSVKAILLTGEGRAFCAGQDLADVLENGNPKNPYEIVTGVYNPLIKLIREIQKPVVCVVNGTAAGAGANIALACDIVVASDNANFIQAFSKIGLIPDSGGTFFLPRLVGFQKASAMMMLAEKISAKDAYETGMIYKVFSDVELMNEAGKIASTLAKMPTNALGLIKKALNQTFKNDLGEQLNLEAELQKQAGESENYSEGIKAFLEKRKPEFK